MRILVVNWTWYPSGGDWTYVENLVKFYESRGHIVIPFSMANEKNFDSEYSNYFIANVDYKQLNRKKTIYNGIKAIKKSIYSKEAKIKIRALLDDYEFDLVHINNIHHYLTPSSIIPEIKKKGIPIIWTLHDYVMLCPNTTFLNNGKVCEKCKGGKYYQSVVNKCKKGSVSASMLSALENYTNDFLNPYKYVDYFICPSKFIARKFIEYGYPQEKIVQIYNLFDSSIINQQTTKKDSNKKYLLYVGNILKAKGVSTLINATKHIGVSTYIIGDGEDRAEFEKMKNEESLDNIVFLGKKDKSEVIKYLTDAMLVIVPSEWYENLPYSLVEALLMAKPVLGANIGGIPELIIDGETGFLFEPGNVESLKQRLQFILSLPPEDLVKIGKTAHAFIEERVSFDKYGIELSPLFATLGLKLKK